MNNNQRSAYLRDASGNIMAEYTFRNGTWTHTVQHLYGAERLGVHKQPTPLPASGHVYAYLGVKNYELTNHLGNVMAVVTDRSFVHASGGFATAEVVSATDYFPFGMEMPGRVFAGSGYDFGFNTQMESPEILPGHTTAQFWEYDSRIGRRWELDPKTVTGWSGYACLGDSPIGMSDLLGDTADDHIIVNNKGQLLGRRIDPKVHKVTVVDLDLKLSLAFEVLLKCGITYNIEGVLAIDKSSRLDIVKVDDKGYVTNEEGCTSCRVTDLNNNPKRGISREHGTYLRYTGGLNVDSGPEDITGDPKSVFLNVPFDPVVGTAHTHPNEGKGSFRLGNIATIPDGNYGPSIIDKTTQAPPLEGFFNIVIDKKSIHFYDRDTTFTISRNEL